MVRKLIRSVPVSYLNRYHGIPDGVVVIGQLTEQLSQGRYVGCLADSFGGHAVIADGHDGMADGHNGHYVVEINDQGVGDTVPIPG